MKSSIKPKDLPSVIKALKDFPRNRLVDVHDYMHLLELRDQMRNASSVTYLPVVPEDQQPDYSEEKSLPSSNEQHYDSTREPCNEDK